MQPNHKTPKHEGKLKSEKDFRTIPEWLLYRIQMKCRADYGFANSYVFEKKIYSFGEVRSTIDGIRGKIFDDKKVVGEFRILPDGVITSSDGGHGFDRILG